ncbi:hypothetical protein LINGRAPRIM_LOCUS1051 [Linum grandiflorum]
MEFFRWKKLDEYVSLSIDRALIVVTVTPLVEQLSRLRVLEPISMRILFGLDVVNAGCFGAGNCTTSLVSIDITSDIVGLSSALYSMHSSPTLMHLRIWFLSHESSNVGSINFNGVPSFHSSHV